MFGNIQGLFSQFGQMMNVFKGGGNPMNMMSQFAGKGTPMATAFAEGQKHYNEKGASGLEEFVKEEFRKSGLDIQEVRRTLGI